MRKNIYENFGLSVQGPLEIDLACSDLLTMKKSRKINWENFRFRQGQTNKQNDNSNLYLTSLKEQKKKIQNDLPDLVL